MKLRIAALCLMTMPLTPSAGSWVVCKYETKVERVDLPGRVIIAKLVRAKGRLNEECPLIGESLTFGPETADYQGPLPVRNWPKKGQSSSLTYRHLDGFCKNDGNTRPCRIKHFSIP